MDAFLDFETGDLRVVNLVAGPRLEEVTISTFDNVNGTIDFDAFTLDVVPPTNEFLLATVTFVATKPFASTQIDVHQGFPRVTAAAFGGNPVPLRSLAGLELARLVEAATSITPVLFEPGGNTRLDLSIFGPPTNITMEPPTPSNNPRPSFTWGPPLTGDVVSYEVRIIPDMVSLRDIGDVTSFTPGTGDFPGPGIPDGLHTFQIRSVGSGDRKNAIGSLDFLVDTRFNGGQSPEVRLIPRIPGRPNASYQAQVILVHLISSNEGDECAPRNAA